MITEIYRRGIELRHLAAFAVVAEALSFREAARRLGVTQPALSTQIRVLETRLGETLFERGPRGVRLTAAGRRLRRRAEELLAAGRELLVELEQTRSGPVGRVSIWYGTQAMFTVLPVLLGRLHREAPGVEFELVDATTEQMVKALRDQRADIAFLHPPVERRGLELRPLLAERFCAVIQADHRLARRAGPVHLRDLAPETVLLHAREDGPALYDEFMADFARAKVVPRLGPSVCQPLNVIGVVAAGIGVGFVAESMKRLARTEVIFRELEGSAAKLELAVARRTGDQTQPVAWLWRAMREAKA